MILAVLMVLLSAACSTEKEPDIIPDVPVTPVEPPVEDKTVDLLLSVSTTQQESATRQSAEATQNAGNFRGIEDLKVIPFNVQGAITNTDTPMQLFTEVPSAQDANNKFYLAELKDVIIGTASFLCYAKAIKDGENVDKPKNGVLTFDHNANYTPSETTFSLEKIYDDNWSGTEMEYMTQIATADGWNTNSDDGPSTLFKEFAAFSNGEYQPFAGSSANIVAYVNKWYTKVGSLADESLKDNIRAKIHNTDYVNLDDETDNTKVASMKTVIPSASLPAGSAVIKWVDSENKFMYQNTPNDPESYVYPAELYYYANSQIKTSTTHWKTEYQSLTNTWDNILGKYTVDNGVVDATTRSIAIKEPLSYGVACLAVKIRAGIPSSQTYLEDFENTLISINGTSFPLTAILVGSQVEQGFDFTPKNPANDAEKEHIIYDPEIFDKDDDGKDIIDQPIYLGAVKATDETTFSNPVHTLALQTKEDKTVKVVLEFENNSDKTIVSESGDIFPGTKFYMVASIIPTGGTGDSDLYNRVLTRGHITTIELTIKSLKQAYNTLPNLNSDKLRVFETVKAGVSDWKPGLTTSHDVYNW